MNFLVVLCGVFVLATICIWFLLFNLEDFYDMIDYIKYKTKEKWKEFKK